VSPPRSALVPPWPVKVFAVDDTSAQLVWRASPAEGLRLEIGGHVLSPASVAPAELALSWLVDKGLPATSGPRRHPFHKCLGLARRRPLDPAWPGGPGAVVVNGLSPATSYEVVASADGASPFLACRLRTLRAPEGRLLTCFATVSDVHIGDRQFGVMGRIQDPSRVPGGDGRAETGRTFGERALAAAIAEAAAWGAQLLVVKGDLTRMTVPAEVREFARLLASSPVPVEVMLGNHDNKLGVNVHAILQAQGFSVPWSPVARDIPGLRLVLANTNAADTRVHRGHLDPAISHRLTAIAAEAADVGTPVWVGLHHPPEMHPFPTVYPPGIPYGESQIFLRTLANSQPASMVSCGHRHRNRRYELGPLVISEVSSTRDYPGVWAGYRVFEGGIVQVVRRTSRTDVIAWTEATRRAVNGQWARWSPGRLSDRCFSVEWART